MKLILLFLALIPLTLSSTSYHPGFTFDKFAHVVEYISQKFNKTEEDIRPLVELAYDATVDAKPGQFPTMLDVLAVMGIESSFRTDAKHPVGPSLGLMQINQGVHKVKNLLDPSINVSKGVEILRKYRQKTKSDSRALVYYNAGPTGAKALCGTSVECKTQYTSKFYRLRAELQRLQPRSPSWQS